MKIAVFLIINIAFLLYFAISHNPVFTQEVLENKDFPANSLKQAIDKTKANLNKTKAELKPDYIRHPGSLASVELGYYESEVYRALERGKETLIDSLDDEGLAGYRAHVEKFYPVHPELSFVGIKKDKTLITLDSAETAFKNASEYIKKIEDSAAQPIVNFTVVSQPSTARFEMWVRGSQRRRELTTSNPLKNVPRGFYLYRVTKAGHKTIEGELDLIDGDGSELQCLLNITGDNQGPNPCSFR